MISMRLGKYVGGFKKLCNYLPYVPLRHSIMFLIIEVYQGELGKTIRMHDLVGMSEQVQFLFAASSGSRC